MKHISLLIVIFAMSISAAFANESDQNEQKFYCSAEQIELSDAMILVHMNQSLFEVDALLVDQGGIFFTENMMRCVECRRPLNPKNTCECR